MRSGMIGKIQKAHRYAEERERFRFESMQVRVRGDNADHVVSLQDGGWRCSCDFFQFNDACAHSMALERLLDGMIARPLAV